MISNPLYPRLSKNASSQRGADGKDKDARKKALAAIEPSVLKEKFLLESDKIIQDTDRPERLQLRMPARGEARCPNKTSNRP